MIKFAIRPSNGPYYPSLSRVRINFALVPSTIHGSLISARYLRRDRGPSWHVGLNRAALPRQGIHSVTQRSLHCTSRTVVPTSSLSLERLLQVRRFPRNAYLSTRWPVTELAHLSCHPRRWGTRSYAHEIQAPRVHQPRIPGARKSSPRDEPGATSDKLRDHMTHVDVEGQARGSSNLSSSGASGFAGPANQQLPNSVSSKDITYGRRASKAALTREDTPGIELAAAAEGIQSQFPQGKIRHSNWADEDWARLYATRFFSLGAIVRALKLFGVQQIGPISMKEILIRCMGDTVLDMDLLQGHLQSLDRSGISADRSTFCSLVSILLGASNEPLLRNIAECDLHPSEFDNTALQEILLAKCDPDQQNDEFHRIWETLMVGVPIEYRPMKALNLLLRRALLRKDSAEIGSLMQRLKRRRANPEQRSFQCMEMTILSGRELNGSTPLAEVGRLVQLWTEVADYGCELPMKSVNQALHALRCQGDHESHDKLFLKLVEWCAKPERQDSRSGVDKLDMLLEPHCLEAILLYSFYYGRSDATQSYPLLSKEPQERAAILASHPAFGGLRLLLRLEKAGCKVDIHAIEAILRKRIWMMYGPGYRLPTGHRVRSVPHATMDDYRKAAEMLIGSRDTVRRRSWRLQRKARALARSSDAAKVAKGGATIADWKLGSAGHAELHHTE